MLGRWRRWVVGTALTLLSGCQRGETLVVPGYPDRPVVLWSPSTLGKTSPAPLLYVLHAYDTSPQLQQGFFRAIAEAESRGFRVAMPVGRRDSHGALFWNATDACCDHDHTGGDELAYLEAVHATILRTVPVDPDRVWAVGVSNGAFMARAWACGKPGRLEAVVTVAGGAASTPCGSAVRELTIHGDADEVIAYSGGRLKGLAPYPSAEAHLPERNAPPGERRAGWTLDGHEVSELGDARAKLWRVHGGKHQLRLDAEGRRRVFEFLEDR